jgi:hypothetical protein
MVLNIHFLSWYNRVFSSARRKIWKTQVNNCMTQHQFYILLVTICLAALAGYFFVFRIFTRIAAFIAKGVLIGILLISSAVFVPKYFRDSGTTSGKKNQETCLANSRKISRAIESYAGNNRGKCPVSITELVPEYLDEIPFCPEAELDTYSHTYIVSEDSGCYTFYCSVKNHRSSVYFKEGAE